MSAVLIARRLATERLIGENPVSIVIHREVTVPDLAGGNRLASSTTPPIHGRIVPTKRQMVMRQDEAGIARFFAWTLIAPWAADLKVGDTFFAQGQNFRVERVVWRSLAGEIYAVHAVLEEVI
jgi:hypothetical protein